MNSQSATFLKRDYASGVRRYLEIRHIALPLRLATIDFTFSLIDYAI
ncbi:hypothetical protein T4E_4236 [Trichinella pseudospiralis]|uniref:Uncharacterized protein n=1 Tax=Trichinella pseudospiralis TaxID=6337 RepID=A0A0V0WPN6_TRIPS|nr:hypothetical protein T4E_4236 [Trichinella pseudospiralis]